jgi:RNA polymerase sigma-70 factor, ECF subfamily
VVVTQAPGTLVDPGNMKKNEQEQPESTPQQGSDGAGAGDESRPLKASDFSGQGRIDFELMQRVAANQEAGVGELYDRFGSLVFRMAVQSLPTRDEADDAMQEIFVRLWKTADRYDPRKAALVTWVMLLTRRHLVDKLRRKRARIKTSMFDDGSTGANGDGRHTPGTKDISARMERDENFKALMLRVDTLPELQRTVVVRAYLGGQTLRQISEELDTPLGTIKSALSRALVRLRERTEEEVPS